jgi:hypothetical protein
MSSTYPLENLILSDGRGKDVLSAEGSRVCRIENLFLPISRWH